MERADNLLARLGFAASRTQAQRLIRSGCVRVLSGGEWLPVKKTGEKWHEDTRFEVTEDQSLRYVSRGGLKLAAALQRLDFSLDGWVTLDVGQSTGGFTDCLLQWGAERVVGVDVGRNQLAKNLREDPRVIAIEGVNARQMTLSLLEHTTGNSGFDLAVMDVSFISQTKIFPSLVPLLAEGGRVISLVKPQFEVGRSGVGKGGIVRDERLYQQVEQKIVDCCIQHNLQLQNYFDSPILGGDGNREFFAVAQRVDTAIG